MRTVISYWLPTPGERQQCGSRLLKLQYLSLLLSLFACGQAPAIDQYVNTWSGEATTQFGKLIAGHRRLEAFRRLLAPARDDQKLDAEDKHGCRSFCGSNPTTADVLDRRALAARWGVSTRSIARLEASGAGPRAFRVGRLVRWSLDEVRRFETVVAAKRRSIPSP
jgi:predicted DNA-binding transcriptional regulator AlpA